jgi:hypothetical protein
MRSASELALPPAHPVSGFIPRISRELLPMTASGGIRLHTPRDACLSSAQSFSWSGHAFGWLGGGRGIRTHEEAHAP